MQTAMLTVVPKNVEPEKRNGDTPVRRNRARAPRIPRPRKQKPKDQRATRLKERPDFGPSVWEYTDGSIRGDNGKLVKGTPQYPGTEALAQAGRSRNNRNGIAMMFGSLQDVAAENAERLRDVLMQACSTDTGLLQFLEFVKPMLIRQHDAVAPAIPVHHTVAIGPARTGPVGFENGEALPPGIVDAPPEATPSANV